MSETEREPAPGNSLPDWSECSLRVENSNYLAKRKAGGGYGPEESTAPQATELHRFIYEYDDADLYRSAWFMYRLELLLNETKADLQRQLAEAKAEIEAMRSNQNPLMLEYRRQLGEAEDEISAMQPMVDSCKERYEHHNKFPGGPNPSGECVCITCQWYREYLGRKQP